MGISVFEDDERGYEWNRCSELVCMGSKNITKMRKIFKISKIRQ